MALKIACCLAILQLSCSYSSQLALARGQAVSQTQIGCPQTWLLSQAYGANATQPGAPTPSSDRWSGAPAAGYSAPLPGASANPGAISGQPLAASATGGAYSKLPLNPGNAIARLEELRNLMPVSRASDFQDAINEYCDWLSEMSEAHWRLTQTFSKSAATKSQADSEKQLCLQFGGLKRQAMLLKAEFLISQKRCPEAMAPLVDIVTAEPNSETGQNAYRLLKEIGFSAEIQRADLAKTAGAPN